VRLSGAPLPSQAPWPPTPQLIHEIRLPHPPVELSPNFLARLDSRELVPGARHYNPSICRLGQRIFVAYRVESFSAVSSIGLSLLDSELTIQGSGAVRLPNEKGDNHWEDPRLCVAGGRLWLLALMVRLQLPPVCQPRLFAIDPDSLAAVEEIPLGFGKIGGIEKNWTPFEDLDGKLCLVYSQHPRMVLEVATRAGHTTAAVPIDPPGASCSGRASPVAINWIDGAIGGPRRSMLEFVGGWVRIPGRGGRYWYGAQLFDGFAPYRITHYTKEPLLWGTEASPTLHSPRPGAGHPCCVFPGGAILEQGGSGDFSAIVSIGVNDSYCCLMRYTFSELLERMVVA